MVSLAVGDFPHPVESAIEESKSLRDFALWYPELPPVNVHLNDDYFTARISSTTKYQPLCWTMFGGSGGEYLRYLTGISVTYGGILHGIEFHYNTENVPVECRKLGRYKPSEYDKIMHFPINGPDGEVIDAIEVYIWYPAFEDAPWFYKQGGALAEFKASCSYSQECFWRLLQLMD